jgi:hypothetical protein
MQAAPAIPVETARADAPAAAAGPLRAPAAEGRASNPWLYRSEGFAEDLDAYAVAQPDDPPLLRWGLPVAALIGVIGLAAVFTLV